MPKGYVIFTEDIHDQAQINAYAHRPFGRSCKQAARSSWQTMHPS